MKTIVRGNRLKIRTNQAIRRLESLENELRERTSTSEVLYAETLNEETQRQYILYGIQLDRVSEMLDYLREMEG